MGLQILQKKRKFYKNFCLRRWYILYLIIGKKFSQSLANWRKIYWLSPINRQIMAIIFIKFLFCPNLAIAGIKDPTFDLNYFFIIGFISKVLMKIIKIFNKKAAHKGLLFSKEDEIIYFIVYFWKFYSNWMKLLFIIISPNNSHIIAKGFKYRKFCPNLAIFGELWPWYWWLKYLLLSILLLNDQ